MTKTKRIGSLFLALIIGIFPAIQGTVTVYADDSFEKFMDEQGFPESYRSSLRELHELHPNWRFEAFQTGLDWEYVIENEMYQTRNLIPNYPYYVTSLFDTVLPGSFDWVNNNWTVFSAPYWVQVSREGLEYYLDPRNWIKEENIFMFELLSFNEETQTLEGVERILNGTFMANSYINAYDSDIDMNPYFSSNELSTTNVYIAGIEPGTIASQVLDEIDTNDSRYECKIIDKSGEIKEENAIVGTGDSIAVYIDDNGAKKEIDSYPVIIFGDINGDGAINAMDRAYVKGYVYGITNLNQIQLKAADINQDGTIDAMDRAYLKGYVYGITKINQTMKNEYITYAEAFYRIGKELNISPYHLAARVRQEQGVYGTSALISGTVKGYEGYYNYFNIGAFGATMEQIITNGMNEALTEGWNTRYKALHGGAVKLATGHIWKGQDTLYLQKFDVEGTYYGYFWHQYMQNVVAPYSESSNNYKTYSALGTMTSSYTFKIPVYENMPDECPKPVKDGNPNTRLKAIEIKDYPFKFSYNTFTYSITVPKNVTCLDVSAEGYASTTKIEGIGNIEIDEETKYIEVITTAENGDKLTYRINMKRTEVPN